ncbi:MAG TPA: CBS domain-containing protein [Gemmataceae bacterium]|jgi:CBS domain-containing protein
MLVRDIMSRDVQVTRPHSTLREAAELMKVLDVGPLPVCDDGRLVGIITDRDITTRAVAEGQDCWEGKVRDAMSRDIAYCFDDDDDAVAARLMQEKQVRRLLVLDRAKQLVGIVSLGDLSTSSGDKDAVGETLRAVSRPNS